MQKAHENIEWKNFPSKETALNDNNLNKMDYSIDVIDDRVIQLAGYEERVKQMEDNAKESEDNAKASEENAHTSEEIAQSYAVGTNGAVRPDDATDNAKYYSEKAKEFVDQLTIADLDHVGVVKPDGTTTSVDADGTIRVIGGTGTGSADGVTYDHTKSGMKAVNVQEAIDELNFVEILNADYEKLTEEEKRSQNYLITDKEGGGGGGTANFEHITYEYYLEHYDEVVASGKDYFVEGGGLDGIVGTLVLTKETYLANQDHYDSLPVFLLITGTDDVNAHNIAYKDTNVESALDSVNSNLKGLLQVVTFVSNETTVSANNTQTTNNTGWASGSAPSGYTILGVVGFTPNNTSFLALNVSTAGNNPRIDFYNRTNASVTGKYTIKALYIKNL